MNCTACGLSKTDRRSRHLATAHHFEAAHDDELAGVVAAHYLEAFRATPEGPDADALAARARDWLGQATERATSLGSPEQALVFAEQALAITPGGIERTDLLHQAARAANDALRPLDERIAYLQEAVDILHDLDDPDADVVMMGALVDALGDAARLDDVRSVVREMERRLGDGGGDLARAELDLARAEEHVLASDMDVCLRCIDPALAGFERAQAWGRFWPSIQLKALVLANLGRHREAMTIRRGILAVATEEDDLRTMSMTLLLLGTALAEEDVHESLRCTLEAAAIARRGGYGIAEVGAPTNGVEAAVEAGEWSRADELLADLRSRTGLPTWVLDAIALRTALLAAYRGQEDDARSVLATLSDETLHAGHAVSRADYRRTLACVDLMTGDLQGGYEEAMAAIDEEPEGMNSPAAAWNAGCAALWLGDAPKARAPLERTLPLPGRWVASTRRVIEAGIAALEGHPQEAAAEYESVLSGLLSRGDRFTHAVATLDAVAVLPEDLVPAGAVEAARTYLEDLGAEALLARLRSVGAPVATER